MSSLRIDVWSDIACPWCYVGKRRFEAALADFPHRDAVELVWRSFELDPSAPKVLDDSMSYAERLARKYRLPVAQAEAMMSQMKETAAAEGLDFRFDVMRAGNTFDAHRLLHLAHERGVQGAVKERLLRAYFTEGVAMSDHAALVSAVAEAGLAPDEALEVLASDAYAEDVRRDEAQAAAYGISGVPCFVMAGRFAVPGAQPPDVIGRVLERAWRETVGEELEQVGDGAVCGPEGCA